MIIYYFNDFDSVGEAEIWQLQPLLPPQQQEALASTKLLSRKCEIALSYLMLAYAIDNNLDEIKSDSIVVRNFQLSYFNLKMHERQGCCQPSRRQTTTPCNSQFSILNFQLKEHGKPYLVGDDGIFFNISHCKQAIVTAVSNREVGIDVEGRRRFSDSLLQRSFNDDEQNLILHAPEPEMEFARLWTRKEAFFKWTGTGILIDHIKSVEHDATAAGCIITSQVVKPEKGEPFLLSLAQ